jgi:hypothetical protein
MLMMLMLYISTQQQQNFVMGFVPTQIRPMHSGLLQQLSPSSSSSSKIYESPLNRFFDPKIEDPMLPLTEAGLTQIVAPTLQLFWLRINQSPFPSWAIPLYDSTFTPRGALLAPTLVHGAALSCCWLLGCLAAKGYERDAYEGSISQVVFSTIRAGAFACGILILGTQFDLYQEMGGYVQVGDSAETDLRIYRALVEVINDIFFEAVTLIIWRIFRSRVVLK